MGGAAPRRGSWESPGLPSAPLQQTVWEGHAFAWAPRECPFSAEWRFEMQRGVSALYS